MDRYLEIETEIYFGFLHTYIYTYIHIYTYVQKSILYALLSSPLLSLSLLSCPLLSYPFIPYHPCCPRSYRYNQDRMISTVEVA